MTTLLQIKSAGEPTWVDLMTPDVQAAYKFYHAIFGWDYDIGGPEFGNYTTARLGSHPVAGLIQSQPDIPQTPIAWGLYFATHNIESDVARAVELGASVISPAMQVGEFGSMAICVDPTGAMFGFWQAGQHIGWQVSDEPGATTWYELYSTNAKQARDFYAALLGAQIALIDGDEEYYMLCHGEAMLCGIGQIDPTWSNMPPQWISYFAVANIEETAARIVALGGQQMGPIEDSPYGRFAAVADPAGAVFKIIQLPARALT